MRMRAHLYSRHTDAFRMGWTAALDIAKQQAFSTRNKMTAKFFDALELEDECPGWGAWLWCDVCKSYHHPDHAGCKA